MKIINITRVKSRLFHAVGLAFTVTLSSMSSHATAEVQIKTNPVYYMFGGIDAQVDFDLGEGKVISTGGSYINLEDFVFLDYEATTFNLSYNYYLSKQAFTGGYFGAELGFWDFEASDVFGDDDTFISASGPTLSAFAGRNWRWDNFTMGGGIGAKLPFLGDVSEVDGDGDYVRDNEKITDISLYWDFTVGWVF